MTKLSVNINKIATLRNARGGNVPDILEAARNCEKFGADGITVHPRPDERHIRYNDVRELAKIVTTEFNIEGYPSENFIRLVTEVHPTQVTLVPDPPEALTSSAGWDTIRAKGQLSEVVRIFKNEGIRVSVFLNPDEELVPAAAECGADRIELYTEPYASGYARNREEAIAPFVRAAECARAFGLGVNAGHDLNLDNLAYYHQQIDWTAEVSIGHALISDALYLGLENAVRLYQRQLKTTR